MNDDADGAGLTIRRTRVFTDLRNFGSGQVSVGEGAGEFEVQLRKAQRQALAACPARWSGPDDERVGGRVLAKASKTGFDRSSCKAPHIVRLAVEPHPCGQRRANLSRQLNPKRGKRLGEPATSAGSPEPSSTTVGWHGPPVGTSVRQARVPRA